MGNMMLRQVHEYKTLFASAEVAADGNSDSIRLQTLVNAHVFTLDVTAAAKDVQDLLDVYVQTLLDGTNWTDVVHFPTVLGNGGAVRYIEKIEAQTSQAGFKVTTALAAGNVRHLLGDEWRVRWDLTESGPASGSGTGLAVFTFSVIVCPE